VLNCASSPHHHQDNRQEKFQQADSSNFMQQMAISMDNTAETQTPPVSNAVNTWSEHAIVTFTCTTKCTHS